ncbi:MAG: hypothetical protein EU548_07605 [Promethearchaeota archaeon]|nr:MAG: hypothetical protein EU548_07605 [Candidatus Lokiarchaeota archaeon]
MKIDLDHLKELERNIDTIHPEKGKIPIKILGFGEISLVFEILGDNSNIAFKRIPIFDTEEQVRRHIWAYNEYNRILRDEIGLTIPDYDTAWFRRENGKIAFYCIQEKINPASVGHKVIHQFSSIDDLENLILLALREMQKVWKFNKTNKKGLEVGLDGQISNFALLKHNTLKPRVEKNTGLLFLDTSTPMFRINGKEAMEAVLFLKSTPFFLSWLIKAVFLEDVVGRYYDWRRVTIDLIANFFKEQKPEIIPRLIKLANSFFKTEASEFEIEPITLKEVIDYYKEDKMIWVIFQNARRIDRYIKIKLLKKEYDFYLPEKIKR